MNLLIRKAKEEDLEKIQNLNLQLFKKEYEEYDPSLDLDWTLGEKWKKYFLDRILWKNSCVFVVQDTNLVVWYLAWSISETHSYRKLVTCAELENMFIEKEYRLKWWWKLLFESFKNWCDSKNVKRILVEASAWNKEAIDFYRKKWFKDYSLKLEMDL